jgi:hypothetical protein
VRPAFARPSHASRLLKAGIGFVQTVRIGSIRQGSVARHLPFRIMTGLRLVSIDSESTYGAAGEPRDRNLRGGKRDANQRRQGFHTGFPHRVRPLAKSLSWDRAALHVDGNRA